jgi:hypothetical protein
MLRKLLLQVLLELLLEPSQVLIGEMSARIARDAKTGEIRMTATGENVILAIDPIREKALTIVGKNAVNRIVTNPKKVERSDVKDVEERSAKIPITSVVRKKVKSAVTKTHLIGQILVLKRNIANGLTIEMSKEEPERMLLLSRRLTLSSIKLLMMHSRHLTGQGTRNRLVVVYSEPGHPQ